MPAPSWQPASQSAPLCAMAEKPGRGPSRGCEFALAEMEDAGALAAAFSAQATETNLLTQRTLMEQALNALTLPVTFLRPAWFMENFAWDVVSARDQAAYDTGSLYSPA